MVEEQLARRGIGDQRVLDAMQRVPRHLFVEATAAPYASFLYDIKNGEAFNKKQVTDASQVGVRAKDDWTLEVTLEGPRGYFPVLAAYQAALDKPPLAAAPGSDPR